MNVSGPNNSIPAAYRLPPVERPRVVQLAVEVKQKTPIAAAPIHDESVPAGSDPALWSILTSEERVFFARQAALGPIHYGPGQRAPAPVSDAPLGGRIDVRA